jgi:hypothetical protein
LEYKQVAKMETEFWRDTQWEERQRRGGGPMAFRDRELPVEYELVKLPVFTQFEPTRTTVRPWGYVLPPQLATVVPLRLDHGIAVKKLIEPVSLEVETYYATEMDNSEYFQGHYLNKVKVVKRTEKVGFPAGSFFIPTGQPKSNFICYILEPETNDNLVTWGFLNTYLQAMNEEETKEYLERMSRRRWTESIPPPGQLIPMYRLMKKTELKGTLAETFNGYERNRYVR